MVVILQAIQTTATLALPALNADLINQGVLVGDNGYIWRIGGIMIGFSLVQILFAATAVWYGAQVAMGFGRDCVAISSIRSPTTRPARSADSARRR